MRFLLVAAVLGVGCTAEVGELPGAPDAGSEGDDAAVAHDAGSDAGSEPDAGTAPDAGTSPDAGTLPDAGTSPDAGAVFHAVVAAGWGGRRVRSCDDGATWGADVQVAPEADDDWHRSYTPKS